MRKTTQKTLLFRQNLNRTNAEWARWLDNYFDDLVNWDMKEFGDDWHTAQDIVAEICLDIIRDPLVTNQRPDDTFRHTLITLCKHKHSAVTKPWRKSLMPKVGAALLAPVRSSSDPLTDATIGFMMLVVNDLMDKSLDAGRPYLTFSSTDLTRWRRWIASGIDARQTDIAKALHISESLLSHSIKKVNGHVVSTVSEIMTRRGFSG